MLVTMLLMVFGIQAKDKKTPLTVTEGSLAFMKEADATACLKIDYSNAIVVNFDNKGQVAETYGSIDEYNAMLGEDYVRDWPQFEKSSGTGAMVQNNRFNNKKGIKLVAPQCQTDTILAALAAGTIDEADVKKMEKVGSVFQNESEATYSIVVHVDTIDMGNVGAGATGHALDIALIGSPLLSFVGDVVAQSGAPVLVGMMEVTNQQTSEKICSIDINHLVGTAQSSHTANIQMLFGEVFVVLSKMAKKAK